MSSIENEQSKILYLLGCPWGTPSYDCGFRSSPQKNVEPGEGRQDVWYRETLFSQVVSYDFSLQEYFLLPSPGNPEGVANQEGYLRRSKRFDHITDHRKESLIKKISFATVRI